MSLDIFQSDQTQALADASRRIAPDLPATFADTFDNAITSGIEWHNSVASQFAKEHALRDYIQNVRDMTGETLPNPAFLIGGASLDEFNAKQREINEKFPVNLSPMTDADMDMMTQRRMAKVHAASTDLGARERTWGGTAGNVLGGLTAGVSDPVMLATLPLGGMGELGIIGRGLEFGAINAGTELAIDLAQHRAHEAAAPGSTNGMLSDVASAGAFGLVLGGAFGALGKFLKAGSRPLSTSVRDEVNAGISETQLQATNVFPTAAGETAGRDAVTRSVTEAIHGEPITAGQDFDPAHVAAFGEAVGAKDEAALAKAGDRALRPVTFGQKPQVERFDPMPGTEDAETYWGRWLENATPEERKAVGATDQPSLFDPRAPKELPGGASVSMPQTAAKLADEPATYEAVQRNLDRIRLESPDAEFSVQVRMPDGNYQLVTRKLEDVLDEIDGLEKAGKELEACATGMQAAE